MGRGWNALNMSRQVTASTCRVVSVDYPVVNQKINPQLFCFSPMYEPQIVTQNGTQYVSLSPRRSETGSELSEQRRLTLSRGRPGRTDIAKASTGECEMNCSTARYSTH